MKIYRLVQNEELVKFHKELFFLGVVNHPNIVKLLDFGFTSDGHPFLLTTFCGDVNLGNAFCSSESKVPQKQQSAQTWKRISQSLLSLIDVLDYCHNTLGIAHGDIKASNVMMNSSSDFVQLIDWNSAHDGMEAGRGATTKIEEDLKCFAKLALRLYFNFPQGNLTTSVINSMLKELEKESKLRDALKLLLSNAVIYKEIRSALEEFL